jgi:phage baseplate assembly protein W
MSAATTNYGSDLSSVPDLAFDMRMVSDRTLIGQSTYNRFRTPRGTYKGDLNYGHDLEQYMNADLDNGDLGRVTANVQAEATKDERVLSASANVTLTSGNLIILLTLTDSQGPFLLVLGVSQVGVALLQAP